MGDKQSRRSFLTRTLTRAAGALLLLGAGCDRVVNLVAPPARSQPDSAVATKYGGPRFRPEAAAKKDGGTAVEPPPAAREQMATKYGGTVVFEGIEPEIADAGLPPDTGAK